MDSLATVTRDQACDQLVNNFLLLPSDKQEEVMRRIQDETNAGLVKKGKEILNSSDTKVCYLDPTYDKIFKWLVKQSDTECNFMRTFFDTTLFLAYKNLFERKVDKCEFRSEKFDAMTEQLNKLPERLSLFKALLMDVSGKLAFMKQEISKTTKKAADEKKDSLETIPDVCLRDFAESVFTKVEDALNSKKSRDVVVSELQGELTSFVHSHIDQEADISIKNVTEILSRKLDEMLVDIEFQRSKQAYINVRVLQYGAIFLLSQNAANLLPTLLVSICRWDSNQVVRDVFHAALGENTEEGPTVSQVAINIGKAFDPVGKRKEEVEGERRRIEGIIEEGLRIRFPELVKGVRKFEKLWTSEDELNSMSKSLWQNLDQLSDDLQKLHLPVETHQGPEGTQQESWISTNAQRDFEKELKNLEENLQKARELPEAAGHKEKFEEFEGRLQKLKKSEEELQLVQSRNKLRTAYELLCFLSLAPLTPCLKNNKDVPGPENNEEILPKVFNETIKKAYEMVRIENNVENRPDVNEWYVGVANAREEAEKLRDVNLKNLVNYAFSLVELSASKDYITKWAKETFSNPINYGIREKLIKELKDRKIEADKEKQKNTVVDILEKEYEGVDPNSKTPKKPQLQNEIREDPKP